MFSEDDNLGIYDDLDEFQQAEEHKSKELLAWEVKHRNALTEIEDLKARNKTLEKQIRTMEVNLQNLLDTAKSEMKRKEALIGQLRKEKDDICFRRKRGREVEGPGEQEHENKRLKVVTKVEQEVKKNPFKPGSKNDTKSVARRGSRSKSPGSSHQKAPDRRSKIQESHTRRKSKERRRSRSRSPRHASRQKQRSSSRRRSRSLSPRAQVSGSKSQKITSHGDNGRSKNIAESLTTMKPELLPKIKPTSEQIDGYLQRNTPDEPYLTNTIKPNTGDIFPVLGEGKEEPIPGLDVIFEPAAHNQESSAKCHSEGPTVDKSNRIMSQTALAWDVIAVQMEDPNKNPISDDEHLQLDLLSSEISKPTKESLISKTNSELTGGDLNNSLSKLEVNAELLVPASGTTQRDENIKCSSGGSCGVGIRIIEDIRLSEVADIDHIAAIVDGLPCSLEEVKASPVLDEQKNPSSKGGDPSDYNKANSSIDLAPSSSSVGGKTSSTLFAQPDSRKVDHNESENGLTQRAALSLLPGSNLAPPPPSAWNQSYPNLSLEEDAIEKALGQLHQTLSPVKTPESFPSNRARKSDNRAPTSTSPLQTKSSRPENERTPFEMDITDSQSQDSKVLGLELPSPGQDVTIDETIDERQLSNENLSNENLSTVTKRCSLGHTDYQFEQRNDEIILRVKRRNRRRCISPNPPSSGDQPNK